MSITQWFCLQDGHVQYHLHKRGAYNPFGGLDWHLADATGTKGSHLRVRRKAMSSQTTFCTLRGDVTSATLDHELGDYYCDLHWDLATYRYVSSTRSARTQHTLLFSHPCSNLWSSGCELQSQMSVLFIACHCHACPVKCTCMHNWEGVKCHQSRVVSSFSTDHGTYVTCRK